MFNWVIYWVIYLGFWENNYTHNVNVSKTHKNLCSKYDTVGITRVENLLQLEILRSNDPQVKLIKFYVLLFLITCGLESFLSWEPHRQSECILNTSSYIKKPVDTKISCRQRVCKWYLLFWGRQLIWFKPRWLLDCVVFFLIVCLCVLPQLASR